MQSQIVLDWNISEFRIYGDFLCQHLFLSLFPVLIPGDEEKDFPSINGILMGNSFQEWMLNVIKIWHIPDHFNPF